MRYRTRGFHLVWLSPIISYLFLLVLRVVWRITPSYLTPIIQHTGLNILIISIQVLGLSLYFIGHQSGEEKSTRNPFIRRLGDGLLITWGALTILFAYFFYYGELLPWSLEPETRPLVIWDHLQYFTWGLNGALWIVSGLTFLIL